MFTVHGEGEDTTGTYSCDRCEKTYNSEGSLRNHIKTFHEGLRRAQCQQCGKGFLSKNDLNRHVLHIHEGVKVRFRKKFGLGLDKSLQGHQSKQYNFRSELHGQNA